MGADKGVCGTHGKSTGTESTMNSFIQRDASLVCMACMFIHGCVCVYIHDDGITKTTDLEVI